MSPGNTRDTIGVQCHLVTHVVLSGYNVTWQHMWYCQGTMLPGNPRGIVRVQCHLVTHVVLSGYNVTW